MSKLNFELNEWLFIKTMVLSITSPPDETGFYIGIRSVIDVISVAPGGGGCEARAP